MKRKSGGAFFLGNNLVSWLINKQPSVSLSIANAKYITTTLCCTQFLWMKHTLRDIKVEYDHPISILCDNTSAINLSKNHVMHLRTKNIPIKYHFLREQVEEHNAKLEYISTKEHIAYIFTKPLPKEIFGYLRQQLGVISISSSH
jgi:hypothetical protein